MPEKAHLDVSETFESQKALVTTLIIPSLFKVLDPVTYLIGEVGCLIRNDSPKTSSLKRGIFEHKKGRN